jgi:hypothetical protein
MTLGLTVWLGLAWPLDRGTAAETSGTLDPQALSEGWISLFDGQTLFGWRPTSNADWSVVNGAIAVGRGEPGLLRTTTQFSDFELQLEYRCPRGTNSGVFLRTSPRPDDPSRDCYEVNIAPPDNRFPTASLVGRQRAQAVPEVPGNEWHTLQMSLSGARVRVSHNGQQLLQYDDPRPLGRGYIGLQFNEGPIAFRNIRLKPWGLQSLFNGRDLTGWKTYPDMVSVFRVTPEGDLNVRNGRGQLETVERFADFVLQLECITHGPDLNSGIFFRCIPGEVMNGYESQIHNGRIGGDRAQPADHGTGGIFRRQAARRVVADDRRWFHKTIIAEGPHMAAWVDGYQVSDWTDTRTPHNNPRNGLRLAAGTIILQGHDPTTDLSFRNLRAVELTPRRP